MNKRPKSREETPKEGSDSARRYRTATICGRAAQSASPFDSFAVHNSHGGVAEREGQNPLFYKFFIYLQARYLPGTVLLRSGD